MNYKKIPYNVQWIDIPDIVPTLRSLGVAPNAPQTFGGSKGATFTLPTVKLPDGSFVMDSMRIARQLDATYLEPSLHLETGLHEKAQTAVDSVVLPLLPQIMPWVRYEIITERATPYWLKTREAVFGMSIDEFARMKGGNKAWEAAIPGLEGLGLVLIKNKYDSGPFLLGSVVSYGDFVVVATLEYLYQTCRAVFDRVVTFDDSIGKLYRACSQWLDRQE
jgi:glutathione S-transferase